jgi:hypothetical protein
MKAAINKKTTAKPCQNLTLDAQLFFTANSTKPPTRTQMTFSARAPSQAQIAMTSKTAAFQTYSPKGRFPLTENFAIKPSPENESKKTNAKSND